MRKVIGWCVGLIVVVLLLVVGGGYYLTEVALRPHFERGDEACLHAWGENYPTHKPWADSLRRAHLLQEITIAAEDQTPLHAYYIAADTLSTRTALLVHGYTDHPFGMLQYGWIYREKLGCNLLLPALRYHGKSEGTHIQMGWLDRLDVKRWIAEADRLFGAGQQLVVHGLSMGGATVMMLSGEEDLPASVRCIVEDCGYTSVWEQFKKELQEDYHLPAFPVLHVARLLARWRFGWDFCEASALQAVQQSTVPMLFIHGGDDHYVPTRMVYPLYEAKQQGDRAIWIAPEAGHADAYMDHPEEYTRQVVSFCERHL